MFSCAVSWQYNSLPACVAGTATPTLFGRKEKAVSNGLISNSLEFGGIKMRVVDPLPNTKEQNSVFVFDTLFDERARAVEVAHHVSERDVVALGPGQYADRCSLDVDGDLFGFTHFFCASKFPRTSPMVPVLMRDYGADLAARWQEASSRIGDLTLEFLAFAEGRFLTIHPFADFNGRTIRLFLLELLRRLDLPELELAPQSDQEREKYFLALEAADRSDWAPLIETWQSRLTPEN